MKEKQPETKEMNLTSLIKTMRTTTSGQMPN